MDAPVTTVAFVGPPNSGKSALFNRLTGARQRTANYAGVTVECREGIHAQAGVAIRLLDLPGIYSLRASSAEEHLTLRVLQGRAGHRADVVACIVDATNPELGLGLALELQERGLPLIVVLTAADLVDAESLGGAIDGLRAVLEVPVIASSALARKGTRHVREALVRIGREPPDVASRPKRGPAECDRLAQHLAQRFFRTPAPSTLARGLDAITLHPVAGAALLVVVLFLVFQAVFAWSAVPSGWIEAAVAHAGEAVTATMAPGPLRDLLVQAVLGGVGGVLVFLPPILILFAFLVVLEESGYLPRAAFVLDPVMARLGLSGRSLIPLLSSFACAVPGILATRTIPERSTRLLTMVLTPLMTCSARLPVYALLIGAFVPGQTIGPGFNLQGVVLFALYAAGVVGALGVAGLAHLWRRRVPSTLLMELPAWRRPTLRAVLLTLRERAVIFLRRVGGVLLALSILMWGLTRFPEAPPDSTQPAIYHSAAGSLGRALQPLLAPLGFDWQISVALVPGLAAREVVVAALGTVYAADSDGTLPSTLARAWPLPTAFALLAWFVFAPQCLSTFVVLRRETAGWSVPLAMSAGYFGLAWLAAFATYRTMLLFTGGP